MAFLAAANLRARKLQTRHSVTPMSTPGTMPARKSWDMDTEAVTPMTMNGIEGGMIGAMMPPEAMRPTEPSLG